MRVGSNDRAESSWSCIPNDKIMEDVSGIIRGNRAGDRQRHRQQLARPGERCERRGHVDGDQYFRGDRGRYSRGNHDR